MYILFLHLNFFLYLRKFLKKLTIQLGIELKLSHQNFLLWYGCSIVKIFFASICLNLSLSISLLLFIPKYLRVSY